ncbi:MAG: hypothetical protein RL065_1673 [Bacteroidota bacterium]|jgi:hypothetical protein
MKKIVLYILIALPTLVFAQKNKTEKAILQTLANQQNAWNNGDLLSFMSQGYWNNDSLQFVTAKNITKGYNKMLLRYLDKYPDKKSMGILKMDVIKIQKINRSNYLVIGHWLLKREADNPQGHFILLFKKINHKWLIVIDHTS